VDNQDEASSDAAPKPSESGGKAENSRPAPHAGPAKRNAAALAAALRANLGRRKSGARARRDAERNADSED
jgi:hypothetical protein